MRIKSLLSAILIFFTSFAIISCLGNDDTYEYSSDDTIRAFELDTIYGVKYAFTIDQINNRIFNVDSVPFTADTIIDKILITTLSASGYVFSGDTLLITTDSLDLTKTMEEPLELKVYAPDGINFRDYKVEVRIHKQDPDTLIWKKMNDSFSAGSVRGEQKAVILGEKILVFSSNTEVYTASLNNGTVWNKEGNIIGLPGNINLSSILEFKGNLYAVTTDGKIFSSDTTGTTWQEDTRLSGKGIETLIVGFPDAIAGIKKEEGVLSFCVTNGDLSDWKTGKEVPENFPSKSISSTIYKTNTGVWKALITGETPGMETDRTTPWFSMEGTSWADLQAPAATSDTVFHAPYMKQPSIIRYNDLFYTFGGDFSSFHASVEGIVWGEIKKKVLFPAEFKGRTNYSMVVDKDGFIWMIWSRGVSCNDEVWRGRINRLGFELK